MTYCVGILLDEGVVLASDSRTNAGIDRVSTFRKMFTFEKPGERFFALVTAGNLSLTQGVISLLSEWLNNEDPERDLFAVTSMFGAARVVGSALREIHKIDGGYLQQREVDFTGSFILAGQIKGGQLRLFLVYDAGNFIEAMGDTTYFQIGEVKYGKPILDRIIQARHQPERRRQMRADLLRFDHALERLGRPADRSLDLSPQLDEEGLRDPAGGRPSVSPGDPRRLGRRHPQSLPRHQSRSRLEFLAFDRLL